MRTRATLWPSGWRSRDTSFNGSETLPVQRQSYLRLASQNPAGGASYDSAAVATKPEKLQAVRRLNQYRPFEGRGASARDAQDDLVLATLAESGGMCSSVAECQDNIRTLFSIDLHQVEVARSLSELTNADRVERKVDGFRLTDEARAQLTAVSEKSAETALAALHDWRTWLLERWPGLTQAHLEQLEEDLRAFLTHVLHRHGAEAALLLYPEDPGARELYQALEDEGLDFLEPTDSEVEEIRPAALSHFIRRPSESQRLYLGQSLNTTYFWTVLTIDPDAAELVKDIAKGQRVYLDTNLVYRLLGVQGPRFVLPARTIVNTTQEVGYECCVTPWTAEEFRTSLERAQDYLRRYPLPPSEYSELLAEATSDDDFVTAYWRQVKDRPLKIEEFGSHYYEVELLLEELGVGVTTEGCTAIDQRVEQVTDEVALLARVLHGKYRHPELLAHDVKHRLLVEHLRGRGPRRFANAGYWFMTFDSVLPRYDLHARREHGGDLPFCVSAGSWFQIVEAFRPKVEDPRQALADLLASPYVRYRRELSKETAQAIVARVQLHSGGNPELAARVMMNSALVEEIEAASSPAAQTERIDRAIVAAAKQAQEDARAAQAEAERERQRSAEVERAAQRSIREADLKRQSEVAAAHERAERTRRQEEERRTDALAQQKEQHDAQVRNLERIALAQTRRLKALAIAVIVGIAAIVGVLALGLSAFWGVFSVIAVVVGFWAAVDQCGYAKPNETFQRVVGTYAMRAT
jgi:hypothetical protein